jgi:hypothetical protein
MPPYRPSWFDRFTAWVDRLPGPAWAFYVVLGLGVVLVETAIQWREGAFPVGSFSLLQVWNVSSFAFVLGLMHYLDKVAASSLATFRPMLSLPEGRRPSSEEESNFARLDYQLTTLPARPALAATLAGAIFVAVVFALQPETASVPTPLAETAGTAFSTAAVLAVVLLSNALIFLLLYHTVHQLTEVSRIYTRHARINVYQLQPLYALSRPGAYTALGLIAFTYIWAALGTASSRGIAPVEAGLTLVFVAIGGAAFALPLYGAHRRLVAEKEARLAQATARFEATTLELHDQLERGRLNKMDPLNKALNSLEIEQNALRKIPTWPWQPGALRAVLAAVLLPVVVWALQLLLGRLMGS